MANRFPIYELHVLPMFRQLDRQHMLRVNPNLDLWSYESVKANATEILRRAGGDQPSMPTGDVGGFWPTEWRALFARWVAGGFRRLSLGVGTDYKLTKSAADNDYVLSCNVAVPNAAAGDSAAWFEYVDLGMNTGTFRLLVFGGEAVPPPPDMISLSIEEHLGEANARDGVMVVDAAGTRRVTPPQLIG
jgi:hypothetical protein